MKTFKEVWKFPLRTDNFGFYIRDKDYNTVATFVKYKLSYAVKKMIIDCINGEKELTIEIFFRHENGYIIDSQGNKIILIRGWGYLTGSGGLSLSYDEAAKIQDEFANYIVERLNFRK